MRKETLCERIDEDKDLTMPQCLSLLNCTHSAAQAFLKKHGVPARKTYTEVTCWNGRKQILVCYLVDRKALLALLYRMEKQLYALMNTARYKRLYKNKLPRIRSF